MYLVVVLLWLILAEVRCQDCREGIIRLVGGSSPLEGRVEIFLNGYWGTVCNDLWSQNDATVVCRQLGFLTQDSDAIANAAFGPGNGPIALDDVRCTGREVQLADCPRRLDGHNCDHREDAGVRCKEGTPPNVTVEAIVRDTSVLVRWSGSLEPDKYNITVIETISTNLINQTSSILTETSGNRSVAEYVDLNPSSNYTVCVTASYCHQQTVSSCTNIQTFPPTTVVTLAASADNSTLPGGILGSIIALLVFLLIVAGVALAYPRCIRHRVKDKKYLSNISQFLDRTMYLTSNEAYIERTQQLTANQGTRYSDGAEIYTPSAYETISNPPTARPTPGEPRHGPPTRQVTAEAQHYEMCESHLENLARAYEVPEGMPASSVQKIQHSADDYSHLQY